MMSLFFANIADAQSSIFMAFEKMEYPASTATDGHAWPRSFWAASCCCRRSTSASSAWPAWPSS